MIIMNNNNDIHSLTCVVFYISFAASDEKEATSSGDSEKKPEKSKELSPVEKVLQSEFSLIIHISFFNLKSD